MKILNKSVFQFLVRLESVIQWCNMEEVAGVHVVVAWTVACSVVAATSVEVVGEAVLMDSHAILSSSHLHLLTWNIV